MDYTDDTTTIITEAIHNEENYTDDTTTIITKAIHNKEDYTSDTSIRKLSSQAIKKGLHVMELFGGIGLGALRAALAGGFKIRCYTYVDKDSITRRIAKQVLHQLRVEYPTLLPTSAIHKFDKRLPQAIEGISNFDLLRLIKRHGEVDLLGGSWEYQHIREYQKEEMEKDQ